MLNLQQGHIATRQALWVWGNSFVKRQKGTDKSILQPPEECQTRHRNGGQVNMAVNGKGWVAALQSVSASSVHKFHPTQPSGSTLVKLVWQSAFKIHTAHRESCE